MYIHIYIYFNDANPNHQLVKIPNETDVERTTPRTSRSTTGSRFRGSQDKNRKGSNTAVLSFHREPWKTSVEAARTKSREGGAGERGTISRNDAGRNEGMNRRS